MKKKFLLITAASLSMTAFAQQTAFYKDPQATFKEAKEYFQKDQYSLAFPLFKELQEHSMETDRINLPVTSQEIEYYFIVCALKQNEGRSEDKAISYIDVEKNTARVQMMNFHLGEYYYRNQKCQRSKSRRYHHT